MPNTVVQFEQRLEPFVEGFDGLAASRVKPFAARALVELASLLTKAVRLVARWLRFPHVLLLRVSSVFRAEKTPIRAMALVFPFHFFCHVVAIVATVGQHMLGFLRQVIDFGSNVVVSFALAVSTEASSGKTMLFLVAETTTSKL
tara:strand:- start:70 stop:504 length:435 start_codon:yes stop_codon:yes gene_type:complete